MILNQLSPYLCRVSNSFPYIGKSGMNVLTMATLKKPKKKM